MRITLPDRSIDLTLRLVRQANDAAVLTELEARLLGYLAAREGEPVHRDALLVEVWGYPRPVVTRCVDTAVRRLRRKIEPNPGEPQHLLGVSGTGYRFVTGRSSPTEPRPAPPTLVGREALIAEIHARLATHAVVTLVGPPGAGRWAVGRAAALAHDVLVGREWPEVDVDPGPSAIWLRVDPVACTARQLLVRDAPSGHAGEHVIVVGGLSDADAEALVQRQLGAPISDALREWLPTLGGLPGPLRKLADALRTGPPDAVVASIARDPSQLVEAVAPLPPTLAPLCAFCGPFWQRDAEALLGGALPTSRATLLATGALQALPDGRLRVPFTRHTSPSAQAKRAHRVWLHQLAQTAPSELAARLPDVHAAILTTTRDDADAAIALLATLAQPLRSHVSAPARLAWIDAALAASPTPPARARALLMRARLLRQLMRLAEAHACLDATDDASLRGEVLAERALVFHVEVRRKEALDAYQAAAIALADDDPPRALMMREEAAGLLHRLGHFDEAEALARETARLAEQRGEIDRYASAELRLGRLLAHKGWHWEALPRMRHAIELLTRIDERYQLAFGLFSLGDACIDGGERDEALRHLHRGRALADALALPTLIAMYDSGIGLVHLLNGEPVTARRYLEDSVRRHQDAGQPARTCYPLGWLAVALADLGYHTLARAAIDQVAARTSSDDVAQHLVRVFDALTRDPSDPSVAETCARVGACPQLPQNIDLRVAFSLLNARCHNSVTR